MAATKGHRGWGWVRKLPSGNYQASYLGPDLRRHYAPMTFTAKMYAEGWLSNERQSLELGTWTPPAQRAAEKKAAVLTLADYAATWIEYRNVKPSNCQYLWIKIFYAASFPTFTQVMPRIPGFVCSLTPEVGPRHGATPIGRSGRCARPSAARFAPPGTGPARARVPDPRTVRPV